MPLPFLAALFVRVLIAFAVQVVGYLLTGQAKTEKTEDVTDLEGPTAEAGRPIPVLFGELEITGLNCLWYGEKSSDTFETDSGGGK